MKGWRLEAFTPTRFKATVLASKTLKCERAGTGFCFPSRHAYATIHSTNLAATLRRGIIGRPRHQLTTGRSPEGAIPIGMKKKLYR